MQKAFNRNILKMAQSNIHRRTAATIFTSKHYYKKKKKRILTIRNPIHLPYLHFIISSKKHQFSNEHLLIISSTYQIKNQPAPIKSQTKHANQSKPLSAPLAQPIINFLTKVATPLKTSICCPS